jgi:hypothetical protein
MDKMGTQIDALTTAVSLADPVFFETIKDNLGTIVNSLNASGFEIKKTPSYENVIELNTYHVDKVEATSDSISVYLSDGPGAPDRTDFVKIWVNQDFETNLGELVNLPGQYVNVALVVYPE